MRKHSRVSSERNSNSCSCTCSGGTGGGPASSGLSFFVDAPALRGAAPALLATGFFIRTGCGWPVRHRAKSAAIASAPMPTTSSEGASLSSLRKPSSPSVVASASVTHSEPTRLYSMKSDTSAGNAPARICRTSSAPAPVVPGSSARLTWDKTRCFGSCDVGASKVIPSRDSSTSSTATAPAAATGAALGELAAVSSSPASAADFGVLRGAAFGIEAPPRALPDPGVLFLPEPSACAVSWVSVRVGCARRGLWLGPRTAAFGATLGVTGLRTSTRRAGGSLGVGRGSG